MLIYIVLVGLILLSGLLLYKNKINKRQFCFIVGLAFILVTGLRSENVGSDTVVYYIDYKAMLNLSWERLMELEKRDVAFYIMTWFLSRITKGSFVVLTLLVAVTFYYPVMKLIYRYSDAPTLSCLILMAFNFFQFSMTGMRQTMAFGFVVLFFLALHKERVSWKKSALFIILAVLFHRSALVALLYPVIRYLSKKSPREDSFSAIGTVLLRQRRRSRKRQRLPSDASLLTAQCAWRKASVSIPASHQAREYFSQYHISNSRQSAAI